LRIRRGSLASRETGQHISTGYWQGKVTVMANQTHTRHNAAETGPGATTVRDSRPANLGALDGGASGDLGLRARQDGGFYEEIVIEPIGDDDHSGR
jgi:hypothetical protein